MERKRIPEAENRLIILYALTRLGPCTAMQLLQFMVEYDLMNYFTMQLALCEMEEQGQLKQHPHAIGALLILTSQGAYTIGTFDHRIPASRRQLIDREAPAWHDRFRLEQQTPSELVEIPGGKCVHLQLLEGDATLMDVMIRVPQNDAATVFLQRRWREAAQEVYELVHHVLGRGFSEQSELLPLPAEASIQLNSRGDYMVSLRCGEQDSMVLSLPEEHMAHWYAAHWTEHGAALLQGILELLHLSLEPNG